MSLIHYIFVRRDLPLGVMAAMVAHAAGESSPLYQDANGHFRGATAVVLEAKDEAHLHKIAEYLWYHDLERVEIYESSEPYANQLMAIGLVPRERTPILSANLSSFQLLKQCLDKPSQAGVDSLNPNGPEDKADPQGPKRTPNMDCQSLLGRDSLLPQSGC